MDDVDGILLESFIEGETLARNAANAEESFHLQMKILGMALGLVTFGYIFFILVFALEINQLDEILGFLLISLAIGLTTFGVVWGLSRGMKENAQRYRRWGDTLNEYRERIMGVRADDGGVSPIEVLLKASDEVPGWIKAIRRSGYRMRKGIWVILYLLFSSGVFLMLSGPKDYGMWPTNTWVPNLIGLILILVGALVYYYWWIQQKKMDESVLKRWQEKKTVIEERLMGK